MSPQTIGYILIGAAAIIIVLLLRFHASKVSWSIRCSGIFLLLASI